MRKTSKAKELVARLTRRPSACDVVVFAKQHGFDRMGTEERSALIPALFGGFSACGFSSNASVRFTRLNCFVEFFVRHAGGINQALDETINHPEADPRTYRIQHIFHPFSPTSPGGYPR